jgi:hypothetical protein
MIDAVMPEAAEGGYPGSARIPTAGTTAGSAVV